MKRLLSIIALLFFVTLLPGHSFAMELPGRIVLKTNFKTWDVNLRRLDIIAEYTKTHFNRLTVRLTEEQKELADGFVHEEVEEGIDLAALQRYLETEIAPDIYREREDVTIDMDKEGHITFEGHGLYGRELDVPKAAMMIKEAVENDVTFVNLPVLRYDPIVTVLSDELKEKGIKELVAGGETDFSGSPPNRINNINVGLSKFNGVLIPPGERFLFGEILGYVGKSTGYLPELVIKGDRTVPEYGGGLCQVSTTSFRAALDGGFKITRRINHSYAVSYYDPIGLDATVYPPSVDFEFINDSPAHILVQAFTVGNHAYYNFYGTKDAREVRLIGPYYFDYRNPPPPRVEYTTKLAPGEKQLLGHAISGLSSSWYLYVDYEEEEKEPFLYHIFSRYQARPDFTAIGTSQKSQEKKEAMLENGY